MKKRFKNSVYLIIVFALLIIVSCKKNKDNSYYSLPNVTTNQITSIMLTTAECTGTITFDGGYAITQRSMCWSTKNDPTIHDSITKDGEGAGLFTSKIANLIPGTKYYLRAYAINYEGTSYGSIMIFTTDVNTVKDIDNNIYKTVQIGNQVWMAENLKTTKYRNGDNIGTTINPADDISGHTTPQFHWAYGGSEDNLAIYGRLYTWYALADNRNICPISWHVPTHAEWTSLENYLLANG